MTLEELEKRAKEIQDALSKWRGMTIEQARKRGWGAEQTKLQGELWNIGYQISVARHERGKTL